MREENQKNHFFRRIWRSGTGLSQLFCMLITLLQILGMRGFFFTGGFRWMQAQDDGQVLYPVWVSCVKRSQSQGFGPDISRYY